MLLLVLVDDTEVFIVIQKPAYCFKDGLFVTQQVPHGSFLLLAWGSGVLADGGLNKAGALAERTLPRQMLCGFQPLELRTLGAHLSQRHANAV